MALAPDGKTLALATLHPSLQLWDVETGKLRRGIEKKPKDGFAHAVAFSPDSRIVAAGWWDQIVLYEVATGKVVADFQAKMQSVNGLAFTPDGKTLLSGTQDGKVRVWDVAEKKLRRTLTGRWGVGRGMALSSDGKTAALGNSSSVIRLWDVGSGAELFTKFAGHDTYLHAAVFSPDGRTLFTGSDNEVRIWRTKDWRQERVLPGTAHSLSLTPDGGRLAWLSSYSQTIRVWDVAKCKDLYQQKMPEGITAKWAVFADDGKALVSLDEERSPSIPKGCRVRLMVRDAASGRSKRSLILPGVFPYALAVTPDGEKAFVGTGESTLLACDLRRRDTLRELRGYQYTAEALAVSPDGRLLLVGRNDSSLRLYEVDSLEEVLTFPKHLRAVLAVAFSPDGRIAASADGNGGVPYPVTGPRQIRFWDVVTGAQIGRLEGHEADVSALAFSPDGSRLVSTLGDSTVLVWDVSFLAGAVRRKETRLDGITLASAWTKLAGADAKEAYRATWTLAEAPQQTLPFLKEHLNPVKAIDPQRIRQWIADLDSNDFTVREAAVRQLSQAGTQVEPALRQTLADKPALEVRRRIEDLLRNRLRTPSAQTLRILRAVAILERIGSAEARQVLQSLARGASAARETEAAQTALQRLKKKR
jgi:WD40 repeat protein